MNNEHDRYELPVSEAARQQLARNSNWFLGLGICLVALGSLAVLFSYLTTLFSVIYFGSFMMVVGFFELVKSFKLRLWSAFFLHLFLGVLYILGGGFIVFYPMVNAVTLTLLLAFFFMLSGTLKIIFFLTGRAPHTGWLLISGIVTLLLGLCILNQWPLSGLWVIGMLVGIEAIFTGWMYIMLGTTIKKSA